jgi:hypothetical protein
LRTRYGQSRQSFFSLTQALRQQPGPRASQESRAAFQDSIPVEGRRIRSVGVAVRQRAFAWAAPDRRDFVVLEYTLRNLTADTLKPLYAGLFMDWDLPNPDGAARNAADWDSTRTLGYCYAPVQQPTPGMPALYAGVRLLRGGAPAVYSIDNNAPIGSPVSFADGFSLPEKFWTLSNDTDRGQRAAGLPNGTDVSQVVGTRFLKLAPGDSVTMAFAMLTASTLAQLQAAADASVQAYATLLPTRPAALAASLSAYPNPTNGLLRVEFPPAFGSFEVQVLNMLGQVVLRQVGRSNSTNLDLTNLEPGLYRLRAQGTGGMLTRAIVLN